MNAGQFFDRVNELMAILWQNEVFGKFAEKQPRNGLVYQVVHRELPALQPLQPLAALVVKIVNIRLCVAY